MATHVAPEVFDPDCESGPEPGNRVPVDVRKRAGTIHAVYVFSEQAMIPNHSGDGAGLSQRDEVVDLAFNALDRLLHFAYRNTQRNGGHHHLNRQRLLSDDRNLLELSQIGYAAVDGEHAPEVARRTGHDVT